MNFLLSFQHWPELAGLAAMLLLFLPVGLAIDLLPTFRSTGAGLFRVPLMAARTVYINAATGSDTTGDGTSARPWQTLRRAWIDRMSFGDLFAQYIINLRGATAFDLDFSMMGSVCGSEAGRLAIIGDQSLETVLATGTATGDMSGWTVPTSAIAGGPFPGDFVRFLTGTNAGAVYLLTETAANSFTVANKQARVTAGAIANGDQWQIVRPTTEIRVAAAAAGFGNNGIDGWIGSLGGSDSAPSQWFFGVRFTTTSLAVAGSQVGFGMCRFENGLLPTNNSIVTLGLIRNSALVGVAPATTNNLLFGAGCAQTGGTLLVFLAQLVGVVNWASLSVGSAGMSRVVWAGGRAATTAFNGPCCLEGFGSQDDRVFVNTLALSGAAVALINNVGQWRWAVTAGSCITIKSFAEMRLTAAVATGGTTDAAGYGCDVRGGGRALYINVTPALTGGTAGSDLRTTNTAVAANATLNANNTTVGTAADLLLGELLSRVAA